MRKMNSNWYRLRWIILNRDKFTCQYCGRKAPDVVLQVDHKVSRANNGSDEEDNLITSCSACNIGKNSDSLGIPSSVTRPGKKKVSLGERVLDYLKASSQGATGTEIASALNCNRANVANVLSNSPLLSKTRIKNQVFYSLRACSSSVIFTHTLPTRIDTHGT